MEKRDRLYNLLPEIYRKKDAQKGEILRALMSVLESEFGRFEEELEQLYDNWFIETCSEWVVPYIGDLLGIKNLHPGSAGTFSQRAYVANTLAHRSRKGTAVSLEQLTKDTTGWNSKAVEYFPLTAITQSVNHVRSDKACTIDIKKRNETDYINSPFENSGHTVDVRQPKSGGRYNIPNIGIHVWPIQSYRVEHTKPKRSSEYTWAYTFDPLGNDIPLFHTPQTEKSISQITNELNVPVPLRPFALYSELESIRTEEITGRTTDRSYFDAKKQVFSIYSVNHKEYIAPEEILITDLSEWQQPEATKKYRYWKNGIQKILSKKIRVAVDPVLGRMAFAPGGRPQKFLVSYSYGFSGDMGGGPYNRGDSVFSYIPEGFSHKSDEVAWHVGVDKENADPAKGIYATIGEAVKIWKSKKAGTFGIISIMDSRLYKESLHGEDSIIIPEGSTLMIVAANWPESSMAGDSNLMAPERIRGKIIPEKTTPVFEGNIFVDGIAPSDAKNPGKLIINGLKIKGSINVYKGNLGRLHIAHCTFDSKDQSVLVNTAENPGALGNYNENLELIIEKCRMQRLNLKSAKIDLSVIDSIIHYNMDLAVEAESTRAQFTNSTIFGKVSVRRLNASNTIFTEQVIALRRQEGLVEYCFVAKDSKTPRLFRSITGESRIKEGSPVPIDPQFISLKPENPCYGRLNQNTPDEILKGTRDGSEMGVFSFLKQSQRESNARKVLEEYLPYGMSVGLFYNLPNKPEPDLDGINTPLYLIPNLPSSPGLNITDIQELSFKIEWDPSKPSASFPDSVLTYQVYYSKNPLPYSYYDIVSQAMTNNSLCTISNEIYLTNIQPNTTYYVTVIVRDENGYPAVYPSSQAKTLAIDPPTVGMINAEVEYTTARIFWTKSTPPVGFESKLTYSLYYSESENLDTLEQIKQNGRLLVYNVPNYFSFIVHNLAANRDYYANVIVKDIYGQEVPYLKCKFKTMESPIDVSYPYPLNYVNLYSYDKLYISLGLKQFYSNNIKENSDNKFNFSFDFEGIGGSILYDETFIAPGQSGRLEISDITSNSFYLKWYSGISKKYSNSELEYSVYVSTENNIPTLATIQRYGISVSDYTYGINEMNVEGLEPGKIIYVNVSVKDPEGKESVYRPARVVIPFE